MPINPDFDFALGDAEAYRKQLLEDADAIVVRSGADALTPEAREDFEAVAAEIERVDADMAARATLKKLTYAGSTDEVQTFELPQINVNRGGVRDLFDLRDTNRLSGRALSNELRARAVQAIEHADPSASDAAKEAATRMVEREDGAQFTPDGTQSAPRGARAHHILRTGSPQYVSEWQDFMANPLRGPSDFLRAMNEGSSAAGSAVVPYFLDPTIILTNDGFVSPIRGVATVKTITTNIWHGVTSAGVNAEYVGEASEVTDASPTFVAPSITPFKADAYVQASMELIADSAISGEIAALLGEAKGRLDATTFATGNGVTRGKGLVTALSGSGPSVAGSSGAAGAADLVPADIYALLNALPARWRNNGSATFLASLAVINKIRQLNTGTTAYQSTFWTDFGGATPAKLVGYDIHEVSDMDSTIVSGSNDDVLLFGDPRQFYIVDRIGLEMAYNPMVLGANRRPTGEAGWVAFWRTGCDVITSNAFKLLRL